MENIKKKKILIIGNTMGIGGVERALLSLINTTDYSSCEIDLLLARPKGEFMPLISHKARILNTPSFFDWILLPKDEVYKQAIKLLNKPVILWYYLKNIFWGLYNHKFAQARQRMWLDVIDYIPELENEYDVVYDFSGGYRYYTLKKVKAKNKYTWVHSDYRVFGNDKKIDYELLRQFDKICCVSETCKTIFDNEFPNLASKSVVELNKIDLAYIKEQSTQKGFTDGFDGIRLLDITRIDENKGLDIAVRVCSLLKKDGLKFKWYILGNDPLGYRAKLKEIIKEYNVEDCFILLGFTSNPYPYMAEADVIVHFSRFEGRSVSIDEALALNKKILLTNYPTAKDQIENGVNGYICDFDEEQLALALNKIIVEAQNEKN